jgi:hypothetical protein
MQRTIFFSLQLAEYRRGGKGGGLGVVCVVVELLSSLFFYPFEAVEQRQPQLR